MASPPFQVEDQTDEDFFDKLVDDDDEIDYTRSVPSFVDGNTSDEVKAFSNLIVSEESTVGVDSGGNIGCGGDGEKGVGDDGEKGLGDEVVSASLDAPENNLVVVSASLDAPENNLVASESIKSTVSNVVECSDAPIGTEGATGNLTSAAGVKEVDWSSFNSESYFHSGSGFGSNSDFFSEVGDNSGDPFAKVIDTGKSGDRLNCTDGVLENPAAELSLVKHHEGQLYETGTVQTVEGQDLNSSQYWENLYPGWRYDPNTGQWQQLDGYIADAYTNLNAPENSDVNALSATDTGLEQKSDIYYSQQTSQSIVGSIAEGGTTGTVSNWNQVSQENAEYPAHMIFDPQYPGWYYDTIAQEWRLLESYTTATSQPTNVDHNQQNQNANVSTGGVLLQNNSSSYGSSYEQVGNYQSQDLSSQDQVVDWAASINNYNPKNLTMWQPESIPKSEAINFPDNQQFGNDNGSKGHDYSSTYYPTGFKPSGENFIYEQTSQNFDGTNKIVGFQSFVPAENFLQQSNHSMMEPTQQMNVSPAYFESTNPASFSQQPLQSLTQYSHASNEGRSSAGRPPHALVSFGFGGKLVIMRENSSLFTNSASSSQDSAGGVVNVFNLAEVVMDKIGASTIGLGVHDYFQSLCERSFPGPLAGGSVGSRELNKWIDDKIAKGEYPDRDYRKGEILKMVFSLLKISCQYYGKLRSPIGSDQTLKDSDCPESALAKLFASDRNGAPVSDYGAHIHCLLKLPSEAHSQATALDVQKLLVSGRKKEALECAQLGQLWGPALALASELGDQFFGDTVKQMALNQLAAGSPLRTLFLLIARKPADVFANSSTPNNISSAFNIQPQPVQITSNYVLDEWEENLAIITANRTKDDELVIIHLGDSLWKERDEVTAAHICYLVAEANFESYSDSARLCLIGADHWKFPRTYASPEAIQRTELYEYSKVLGNPQFILLPFQPYKLIYAHMLAEVGKLSDSLKYCQAIAKSLKTGRTPEVDTWKQLVSSLEERLRTHQQGGYSTNLAPTKLVGKLLNFFDNTAHRVVGGLPPPVPSSSHSKAQYYEPVHQQGGPQVPNSQSMMAMSTLMPSASMEPLSEWTGGENRMAMPNRSISEPDFGKTPKKVDSSKEANSEKATGSGGSSRFGRFGSQLLQKTVGLVLRSRPDKQAKLGEKNRFYYDEKLKRWVEEGAEPPAEEAAPPPPPTTAAFQNGVHDQNGIFFPSEKLDTSGGPEIKNRITSERSPGVPPMPPSSNQFSARGRMGARARYVDTFNKGGETPTNLFQSPSIPAAKSGGGSNPKFFVPSPAVSSEETQQTTVESMQEAVVINENPSTSYKANSFSSPPTSSSSSVSMQRFPSMDNIVQKRAMANGNNSLHLQSRRAASWSGSLCDANNPSKMAEIKPLGEVLGMPRPQFLPSNPPVMRISTSKNSSTEDLHEVEL